MNTKEKIKLISLGISLYLNVFISISINCASIMYLKCVDFVSKVIIEITNLDRKPRLRGRRSNCTVVQCYFLNGLNVPFYSVITTAREDPCRSIT